MLLQQSLVGNAEVDKKLGLPVIGHQNYLHPRYPNLIFM
jgi:hypothetical protein